MWNENLLYKFIRYLLEIGIIYLILRYTPYINLNQTKAIIIAIILTILCIFIEFLCIHLKSYVMTKNKEQFNKKECESCKNENILSELKIEKKCKIICEDNDI